MVKWLKRFFSKNNIEIEDAKNANIYQNCSVINNPASSVYSVINQPEELKLTLGSISQALSVQSVVLPEGYRPNVKMQNGTVEIESIPVNDEAKKKYPQSIKCKASIDIPQGMSFEEALNRARISQEPIPVKMIDMRKMIGDQVDPYQDGFQEKWKRSKFQIVPKELPAPVLYTLELSDCMVNYALSLEFKPVNPDHKIVHIANANEQDEFRLSLIYHLDTGRTDFTYSYSGRTWNSICKYLNFMKSAVPGKAMCLKTQDGLALFQTNLVEPLFGENYEDIDGQLALAREILTLESHFGISFSVEYEVNDKDAALIGFLANSICGKAECITWSSFSVTGNLHGISEDAIKEEMQLSYIEKADIMVLGVKLENIKVKYEFDSVMIENPDKIIEQVQDGFAEQVRITMIPGKHGNGGTRIAVLE